MTASRFYSLACLCGDLRLNTILIMSYEAQPPVQKKILLHRSRLRVLSVGQSQR